MDHRLCTQASAATHARLYGCDPSQMPPTLHELQTTMKQSIHCTDAVGPAELHLVGGLDIQWDSDGQKGFGALVVLSWPALSLVHQQTLACATQVPYQSGLLGFRECPCYSELLQAVAGTASEPQLCLVDGFGMLHPRGCGSASQLGVQTGMPTIGIAKTLLRQSCNLTETECKDQLSSNRQLQLQLYGPDGTALGCAIRRSMSARQPVYVSVGHKVSLSTACHIVQKSCVHRIPEPIRQADILARAALRTAQAATA